MVEIKAGRKSLMMMERPDTNRIYSEKCCTVNAAVIDVSEGNTWCG